MSKNKGPDIKIIKELIRESGIEAASSQEGVLRVSDFRIDGDFEKGKIELDIYLDAVYGYKIPAVSWDVQTAVKSAVRTASGIDAEKIDIHIQGVGVRKEEQ